MPLLRLGRTDNISRCRDEEYRQLYKVSGGKTKRSGGCKCGMEFISLKYDGGTSKSAQMSTGFSHNDRSSIIRAIVRRKQRQIAFWLFSDIPPTTTLHMQSRERTVEKITSLRRTVVTRTLWTRTTKLRLSNTNTAGGARRGGKKHYQSAKFDWNIDFMTGAVEFS